MNKLATFATLLLLMALFSCQKEPSPEPSVDQTQYLEWDMAGKHHVGTIIGNDIYAQVGKVSSGGFYDNQCFFHCEYRTDAPVEIGKWSNMVFVGYDVGFSSGGANSELNPDTVFLQGKIRYTEISDNYITGEFETWDSWTWYNEGNQRVKGDSLGLSITNGRFRFRKVE